jgi:hypothetical protein
MKPDNNRISDNYSIDEDDHLNDDYDLESHGDYDEDYNIEDDEDSDGIGITNTEDTPGTADDSNPNSDDKGEGRKRCLLRLLGMMINPVEGWKKIRRSEASTEDVARECFYPITALAAASCFMECIWKSAVSLNSATIDAVKVFVAFFFGYYLVLILMKLVMPKSHAEIAESDYAKKYVMYNMSTLALFYILYELLPMVGPVLVFLPIWTLYLVIRGARFFRLPDEKRSLLKTLLCIIMLGAPIFIYWAMDLLL